MSLTAAYHAPADLVSALALLREHGMEARVVAGGQSLLPMLNLRVLQPDRLVDISRLAGELEYIRQAGRHLSIGALTRHTEVERSPLVAATVPLLGQTVRHIAHAQIRNRGTIGGSLCHGDPAAEYPVTMVCLEAEFRLQCAGGERWVPAAEFFLAPLTTALTPEELLTAVRIPLPPAGTGSAFCEFSLRRGHFALVAVAAQVRVAAGRIAAAQIALGGAFPMPQRAIQAEAALLGHAPDAAAIEAAAAAAHAEVQPEDDSSASAGYRRHQARVLVRQALRQALGQGD